jgi:hypothetical protein
MLGNIVTSGRRFTHYALLQIISEEAWLAHQLRTTFSPAQPRSRWSATFSQATTASPWGFREQVRTEPGLSYPPLPKPLNDKK